MVPLCANARCVFELSFRRIQFAICAGLFACLLCACGGGGSSSSPAVASASAVSTASVASNATSTVAGTAAGATTPSGPPSTKDAARLLDQSSFGPTDATIQAVQSQGIAAYVDDQLARPATGYAAMPYISPVTFVGCPTGSATTCPRDLYTAFPVQVQFYTNALLGADQLRQRVALAFSQIFVTSGLEIKPAYGMRTYQQMLLDNAFVNYRTLLERVTLQATMGDYLDMVNNNKPSATVQANENFAREVLQLFSLGVSKLNADGSVVVDSAGVGVPTYDQSVVQAFARAFTGWTYAPLAGATSKWGNPVNYAADMVAFDAHHDVAEKILLDGKILPAGQTATKDLSDALDTICNHPNVGPFIGRQLIQALVTSNPTPAYVARITAVFNDNGSGVRGDLRAVIRAILLDSEVRGDAKTDVNYGKLRDPAVYVVSVERALGGTSDGVYLHQQATAMGQAVFSAGSVFSFYPPDYALPGSTSLRAPQFGIANATTSVSALNFAYVLLNATNGVAAEPSVAGSTGSQVDLTGLQALAATPATMVAKLDSTMTQSTMTTAEKNAIVSAVSAVAATDSLGRARMAAYLFAVSPRYLITR